MRIQNILLTLALLLSSNLAFGMHITEGIITGYPVLIYTLIALILMSVGADKMKKFAQAMPEKKPLFGMCAAIIFFVSLIPIPAFTGTTSHPCGVVLVAILLGPFITVALTGLSLLLQAAFFAHGGFGTWGANVIALGLAGCLSGWVVFYTLRKLKVSVFISACIAGFIGDVTVYASSGFILALALSSGPQPQYDFFTYLGVIYIAYLPTQLPIAIIEGLITGYALNHALRQRPEVLRSLGVH
ncbi:MAG: cobalt ABC transporter permease [SAR86 cluster bacterium]|uniref:Cobalt ABC transporter permease n=1 Tax=SAR86 cluster bacterium TaxID=2030880 RepID=A0A2A5CHC8_9GAMM|nr:MAG: cobalt ABC transporter permease [SAR86 cluster bacterium]